MTTDNAREFAASYDDSVFPSALTDSFEPMECFSTNELWETLLVRDKRDGTEYVCKSYNKDAFTSPGAEGDILEAIGGAEGFPAYAGRFEDERAVYILRSFIVGEPLDKYAKGLEGDADRTVTLMEKLCARLAFLHRLKPPVIHRDVKPSNIIVSEGGELALIDFGISRRYDERAESDTVCYATRAYAPPEQYGFAQTDARTDIFSCGKVLRFLMTGSPNGEIADRRLENIAEKCTRLAPEQRYPDAETLSRSLERARPKNVRKRRMIAALLAVVIIVGAAAGGMSAYKRAHTPFDFSDTVTPGYVVDEKAKAEAVDYMREKYGTALFDDMAEPVTVGLLKQTLIEVYGLDEAYVRAKPDDFGDTVPMESENYFLPWGWEDGQALEGQSPILVYAAVKAMRPDITSDWSVLTDDTGMYPGVRAAMLFAEANGISEGINDYSYCGMGELALILARTEAAVNK